MKSAAQLLIDSLKQPDILTELTPEQWTRLIRIARWEDLLAALSIRAHGLSIPDRAQIIFQEAERFIAQNHRLARWELGRLARDLEGLNAPLILLKGCAYLTADLSPRAGRLCGDIDVLVPRSWLGAVEHKLGEAGWRLDKSDPYDQKFYRQWMHELPPFSHPERAMQLDVHHTILPLTSRLKPSASALIADAEPSKLSPYRVLSKADRFLHSATHLFYDGDFQRGLRNLWDLHQLAADLDWQALIPRARIHGLMTPLAAAIATLKSVFETPVPVEVWSETKAFAPNLFFQAAIHQMLTKTELGQFQPARAVAHQGLYARSHCLRMPLPLLIKHAVKKTKRRLGPRQESA
jgi:Uncharacterised nucleotidyltransferase